MFIEIEETVCFLASFLYGKIPRSRVDAFCENLANALVDRIYVGCRPVFKFSLVVNSEGQGDTVVHKAASDAFLNFEVMLSLLPPGLVVEIRQGTVHVLNTETSFNRCIYPANVDNFGGGMPPPPAKIETPPPPSLHRAAGLRGDFRDDRDLRPLVSEVIRRRGGGMPSGHRLHPSQSSPSATHRSAPGEGRRRPQFHVEFSLPSGLERDEKAVPRPFFEVQHEEQIYTAQAFAATRFGSTKLKTYQVQGVLDSACGSHPFTMPSIYAYLQLLVFLNGIACLPHFPDDLTDEPANVPGDTVTTGGDVDTGDVDTGDVITADSVTGSQSADDESGQYACDLSTEKLIKRKRGAFASGDSNDSGAFCDGSLASGASDMEEH